MYQYSVLYSPNPRENLNMEKFGPSFNYLQGALCARHIVPGINSLLATLSSRQVHKSAI